VSASLVNGTVKSATLVAVGQLAGVSTPAVALMEGVMKAMFLKKLRLVIGMSLVLAAVGAVGLGQFPSGGGNAVQAAPPERPLNELEALKRENELLKLNLEVVLEKVRAQEAELREVRGRKDAGGKMGMSGHASGSMSGPPGGYPAGSGLPGMGGGNFAPGLAPTGGTPSYPPPGGIAGSPPGMPGGFSGNPQFKPGTGSGAPPSSGGGIVGPGPGASGGPPTTAADPFDDVETALKALRSAKDKKEQKKANEALDTAMKKLREQLSK
jgi:hypothetical protein